MLYKRIQFKVWWFRVFLWVLSMTFSLHAVWQKNGGCEYLSDVNFFVKYALFLFSTSIRADIAVQGPLVYCIKEITMHAQKAWTPFFSEMKWHMPKYWILLQRLKESEIALRRNLWEEKKQNFKKPMKHGMQGPQCLLKPTTWAQLWAMSFET